MKKFRTFLRKSNIFAFFIGSFLVGCANACIPYQLHQVFTPDAQELRYSHRQGKLAFSGNGKTLVFDSNYLGKVKIFNLNNGKWTFSSSLVPFNPNDWNVQNRYGVHSIAISEDGKTIALGQTESPVALWNVADDGTLWTQTRSIGDHTLPICATEFLQMSFLQNDNQLLLSTTDSIQVWQKNSTYEWYNVSYYNMATNFDYISDVSSSPDGETIVWVEDDDKVRIASNSLDNHICIPHEITLADHFTTLKISDDGNMLVVGSKESEQQNKFLRILDKNPANGEWIFRQALELPNSSSDLLDYCIDISKDKHLIVAHTSTNAYVWDNINDNQWDMQELSRVKSHECICSVAISCDNVIAVGFKKGTVKIYFPSYLNPVERQKNASSSEDDKDQKIPNQDDLFGNLGKKRSRKYETSKEYSSKKRKLAKAEEDYESIFTQGSSCALM